MAGMNGYQETVSELYVCTNYLKAEGKLRPGMETKFFIFLHIRNQDYNLNKNLKFPVRVMAGRPNYNSRNLEAATIILSVSVAIDEEACIE